ncbi:MAG TPA: MurR/RpiR family transcriptional regulator, partial [Bacillota bacterium]|nr:MurR/RpiR family transcriptional regulator [Bacillota bacterium]
FVEVAKIHNAQELREFLSRNYSSFTGSQRAIAEFVNTQGQEVAFMSAAQVAAKTKTSVASVVRFARMLGFEGFAELREVLREEVLRKAVSTASMLESTLDLLGRTNRIFASLVERETANIEALSHQISEAQLLRVADIICGCGRLILFGEGPSASLTQLLEYRLRRFQVDTLQINETGKGLFDKAFLIRREDCLLVFAFLRFLEEVGILLSRAKEIGARTILITDLSLAEPPVAVDELLVVSRGSSDFFQSMVTPLIVTESITLAVGHCLGKQASDSLQEFETFRSSHGYPRLAENPSRSVSEKGKPATNHARPNRRKRSR